MIYTEDKKEKKGGKESTRKSRLNEIKLNIQSSNSYKPKDDNNKSSKRRMSKKPSSKSSNAKGRKSAIPRLSTVNRSKRKDKDDKNSSSRKRSKSPANIDSKTSKKRENKTTKKKKKKGTNTKTNGSGGNNDDDDDEYYQNDNNNNDELSQNGTDTKSIISANDIDREGNDDSTDGSGLYNYEFLDMIDRMRRSGANPTIPQIVLIGPRGCGKTSLLEIITGITLPKGRHNPTFCPLEFNIIRSLNQQNGEILCEMYIKWRYDDENLCWYTKDDTDEKDDDESQQEMFAKFEDISMLVEYIEGAQTMIAESNDNFSISPNSIIVNVYANNVEDIRIVDLPGWIHKQSAAQNVDTKRYKFYDEIIDIYINNNNNNIVAFMFDIMHDMKEYDIFQSLIQPYCKKFKKYHQCIGVISNLGDIKSEQDLNQRPWFQNVLKQGLNIDDKLKISTFIGIHTFNDYGIENGMNSMNLKDEEQDMFINKEPWNYLFDIRNKLGSDSLLHHMGQLIMISIQPELISWKEKLDFRLKKLIIEFKKLPPTITSKDSTAAVSQVVHNFVSEIEKHIKREPGYERTVNRIEYKFLKLRKEIMNTRPRLATKAIDADPQNGIYTMSDLMKLTKITSGYGHNGHNVHNKQQHHGYNDIIHGVRHFLVESVISARWSQPSSICLSSIHSIIGTLLDFLSQKHVHQFIHFQNEIRQTMAELLSKLLGSAKKEIETMLFREKYSPIVDINTLKQKVGLYRHKLQSKAALFTSGNAQLNENIIEILSQSWAYFDVASNRYCDNIVMVIQSTLVRSLHNELQKCFNQAFLTQKPEKLEELLSLDGTQRKRKKQLVQQFKTLTNHRKQINGMIYQNQSLLQMMKRNNKPNNILAISSTSLTNNNRTSLKIPNQLTHADSIENIQSLISDVESSNPLEQIQPLPDEQLSKGNNKGSMMDDEGYEEQGTNVISMQTAISTGEDGLNPGNHGNDALVPVDHYSDYLNKKKIVEQAINKIAQANAQLAAKERQLAQQLKQLRKEQHQLEIEKHDLIQQQNSVTQEMEDVHKEYEELEESRDEFEKEKEEFYQQRDNVLAHIQTARAKLENAAHRMIIEREQFERQKGLAHITSATDNGTMVSLPGQPSMSQTQSVPMAPLALVNGHVSNEISYAAHIQQQEILKQVESQRLLMKQMRDAMIQQKEEYDEAKKRLGQPDYLTQEWKKLDAEKENVAATLHEIEAMMLEITEAEEEATKEREELEKEKTKINQEKQIIDKRDAQLKEKEEYLNEKEAKLQSESKKLKEEIKVNSSMYKNKVKQLKTKNKLLSSKLKQITTEKSLKTLKSDTNINETSEQHHLSLNIGDQTQKDLLTSTFTSVDTDFYHTDNDGDNYPSDDFSTDDSYDLDYYQQPRPGDDDDDMNEMKELDESNEIDISPSPDSIVGIDKSDRIALLPHSTEEILHIPIGDTPEPPLKVPCDDQKNNGRRSTPVPIKGKNALYKPLIGSDMGSFAESPLTSIQSKQELFGEKGNASTSLLIDTDKFKSKKRKSYHQNKAKTIDVSNSKKKNQRESVKLELLNDDMMKEFDILIAQQTRISDDIQSKLHSTLEILEKDFKSYMQRNVELLSNCFFFF